MTQVSIELEALFARFVEAHVFRGEVLTAEQLCGERADLREPLNALIDRYTSLTTSLDGEVPLVETFESAGGTLPTFEGFQTIERLGSGGMGEVFKLRDLHLDRVVAAKVIRQDARVPSSLGAFLREARSRSFRIAGSCASSRCGPMPIRPC